MALSYFAYLRNHTWMQILLVLSIVAIIYINYMSIQPYNGLEGFTQINKFSTKFDADTYDDFYVDIYDQLHDTENRIETHLLPILENTNVDPNAKSNYSFLDIGSGTGKTVERLRQAGYEAQGLDKSQSMIKHCEEKYEAEDSHYQCGDVCEPILYTRGSFSHILCLYLTIYEIDNKQQFFRNCYQWLHANGILVVHLVEKDKFDTISPAVKIENIENIQEYSKQRIEKSQVDFGDFQYKMEYKIRPGAENINVKINEMFIDNQTKKIRQNERNMKMEPIEHIVKLAMRVGFSLYAKIAMKNDKYQFLYFFIRDA